MEASVDNICAEQTGNSEIHFTEIHVTESNLNEPVVSDSINSVQDTDVDLLLEVKDTSTETETLKKTYKCNLCEQTFTRAHSVTRHNKRKHPDLVPLQPQHNDKAKNLKIKFEPSGIERPRRAQKTIRRLSDAEDDPNIISKPSETKRPRYPQKSEKQQNEKSDNPNIFPQAFETPKPKKALRIFKVRNTMKQNQPKKLRVDLSNKIPDIKTETVSSIKSEIVDKIASETSTVSEDVGAVIQTIKESCQQLEKLGQQVLVITTNNKHSQWFGSTLGLEFVTDNIGVVGSFLNHCREKENVLRKKIQEDMNEERDTNENVDFEHDGDNEEDFTVGYNDKDKNGANSEDYNEDENDADNDDDYGLEDDEAEDDENELDHDNDVKVRLKPKRGKPFQTFENLEELFKQVVEGLQENEKSREVAFLLRKRAGIRSLLLTTDRLNKGKYECKKCGYKFLWNCHLEVHQVKNPHCDRVTDFKSSDMDVLKESVTFTNPQTGVEITSTFKELFDSQKAQPLTCAICGKSDFNDRYRLRHHLVQHNQINTFECNICCAGFKAIGFLSTHLKSHFRKSYECHSCQWRFISAFKLKQHTEGGCESVSLIKNKESDELFDTITYKCDTCFAEVIGIKSLREHLTHEHKKQIGPFDCILCNEKFSDAIYYNRHLLTHNKKYPCPFCPKKFSERSNMFYRHLKTHREVTDYPYICDICGQKFKSKRHFDPHRRIHTGERPYVCEVEGCNKDFRSRDGLDQHKWCHVNQHFICDFCGRKFRKPTLLSNHRLSHTLDWRYPCDYCPQKFRKIRPFKRHLARCHPTKVDEVKEKYKIVLHPCQSCDKVFFEKEDHTAHMYRHQGIKPFACNFCGKTFSDKSNMANHEQLHRGGKKLKCSWCSKKFNEEKYLRSHIERLHAQKPDRQVADDRFDNAETGDEYYDELRESTLQIIEETISGNASF